MNTKIETERLLLRPFTLGDIDASYAMNLDPAVTKYTCDGGIVSKAEVEQRIKENIIGDYAQYGYGRFAVELKATEEFIGFCGLKYLDDMDEVDLGYRFMQRFWGKGYATEASKAAIDFGFEALHLKKIIALVLPANTASVHILEKLGFEYDCPYVEEDISAMQFKIEQP